MPYYAAGDYYRGDYYRGDNYAAGGLFSFVGKAIKKVGGALLRATPVGSIVSGLVPGISGPSAPMMPAIGPGGQPIQYKEPGIGGAIHRALPGGKTGYGHYNKRGEFVEGRRPRMNPLNPRALTRANRRITGFVRMARRSLKHTVYTLARKGSRGKKKR